MKLCCVQPVVRHFSQRVSVLLAIDAKLDHSASVPAAAAATAVASS